MLKTHQIMAIIIPDINIPNKPITDNNARTKMVEVSLSFFVVLGSKKLISYLSFIFDIDKTSQPLEQYLSIVAFTSSFLTCTILLDTIDKL